MQNIITFKSVLDYAKQVIGCPVQSSASRKNFAVARKTLLLVALTTAMGLSAKAATMITSLPYTITQPGSYQLVTSLASTTDAITVNADNCTIDLNGFVISYGVKGNPGCRGIYSKNHAKVTVRNGTITHFQTGVFLDGDVGGNNTSWLVENLRITQGTIAFWLNNSSNAVVRGCQIYSLFDPSNSTTAKMIPFCKGIWSVGGFGNLINNNQLCNIQKGIGICLDGSNNDVVDGNVLSQVCWGIVTASGVGDAKMKNNTTTATTGGILYDGNITELPGTDF
jgi:hypothetical protein